MFSSFLNDESVTLKLTIYVRFRKLDGCLNDDVVNLKNHAYKLCS